MEDPLNGIPPELPPDSKTKLLEMNGRTSSTNHADTEANSGKLFILLMRVDAGNRDLEGRIVTGRAGPKSNKISARFENVLKKFEFLIFFELFLEKSIVFGQNFKIE